MSTEEASILMLNDESLTRIFKYLRLFDYLSLAKTCHRLQDVAHKARSYDYARVSIDYYPSCSLEKVRKSKDEFREVLQLIGGHVVTIEISHGGDFILETIRNCCKNLNSMDLYGFAQFPNIQDFRNITELKIKSCGSRMVSCSNEQLRNYFAINRNIEVLEYDKADEDFLKSLQLLPKLNSLSIMWVCDWIDPKQIKYLHHLKHLTRLSFWCKNCNDFLIQLATMLSLVELKLTVDFTDETFDILKSFQNLEILSLAGLSECSSGLTEDTVFPSKLKRIRLLNIQIYCTALFSMVKHLKFLKEIDLCRAKIFWDLPR